MPGLNKDEIYLAPNSLGDLPNVEQLAELVLERPDDLDVVFLLANSYFRIGNLTRAIDTYKRILEKEPGRAQVRCNLGIALRLLGKQDEAISELNQALLASNDLVLAYRTLGEIRRESNELEQALTHFERWHELDPESVSALVELAGLCERKGDQDRGQQLFRQALSVDPQNSTAKSKIAEYEFFEGKKLFDSGDLDAAFYLWWKANTICEPAFVTNENVARGMKELVTIYQRRKELNELFEACQKKVKQSEISLTDTYHLFSRYYFSLGLFPDFYEPLDTLGAELERWQLARQVEGDPPFPHFRMAIIYSYQGSLDAALQELIICRDRLPDRKQEGLKLKPIFDFIFRLRGKTEESESRELSAEEALEWGDYGFPSLFQWHLWKRFGFGAQEAGAWRDAGLSPEEADAWRKKKITPVAASRWYTEGFRDPSEVRRWIKGGFDPQTANKWKSDFEHSMEVAIQCKQVGLEDPKEATQWLRVFMFAWDAASWKEHGFTPSEALTWTAAGFSNAFAARSYKEQGLTPETASRQPIPASEMGEIENKSVGEDENESTGS